MRSTAATLTPSAQAGTPRRSAASGSSGSRTATRSGGVTRPSMRDVGREKSGSGEATRAGVGKGGWAAYRAAKSQRTEKYPRLEVDRDPVVVKFTEAEPFAHIWRHWVSKIPYTCIGEDCPLCEIGHRARSVVFYNVITVDDCVLRVWELSSDPVRKVQKHYDKLAETDKTLDDPGLYFVVSKARKDNGFFEYDVDKVPARDLSDECGIEPLEDSEIEEAVRNHGKGLFTDEVIQVNTKADLREAVEKVDDTDD